VLFTRDRQEPIVLPTNDPALLLVQRIRDEAHRFAVTFHRKARSMRDLRSELDGVPGSGHGRRPRLAAGVRQPRPAFAARPRGAWRDRRRQGASAAVIDYFAEDGLSARRPGEKSVLASRP
jgi:excinuclease ABC subunit C